MTGTDPDLLPLPGRLQQQATILATMSLADFETFVSQCAEADGLSVDLAPEFAEVARFMSSAIVMKTNFGSKSFRDLFEEEIDAGLDELGREQLIARATRLEAQPGMTLYRKGINVLFETERQLSSARFVTDIRPVFDGPDRGAEDPGDWKAVVLVHQLRLDTYKPGTGEGDRLVVAMNRTDLIRLQRRIQRELAKTEKIEQGLDVAGIKWMRDPVEDQDDDDFQDGD